GAGFLRAVRSEGGITVGLRREPGMKLMVFQTSSGATLGVVTSDGVVPLDGSAGGDAMTPAALFGEGEPALSRVRAALERSASGAHLAQETQLQLAPCVYQPGKIVAVGLNYRRHAQETGATIPETPILFSKFNSTLAASCQHVALPRDEVPDPQQLELRTWVNGELRQSSSTADMIFSVAEIVSYASQYMTLDPGDVIITGTPEGVILGMPEPRVWLKPGDEVTVEVQTLGRLVSPL